MISSAYEDQPNSDFYYIYYYDQNYNKVTAISQIDENNLKQIESDLNVDYIQMNKTSNVDYKITDIKQEIANSQTEQDKINSYQDIYYYFAIPLIILFIVDFILKKTKLTF